MVLDEPRTQVDNRLSTKLQFNFAPVIVATVGPYMPSSSSVSERLGDEVERDEVEEGPRRQGNRSENTPNITNP